VTWYEHDEEREYLDFTGMKFDVNIIPRLLRLKLNNPLIVIHHRALSLHNPYNTFNLSTMKQLNTIANILDREMKLYIRGKMMVD
jgi:hypothetical protein